MSKHLTETLTQLIRTDSTSTASGDPAFIISATSMASGIKKATAGFFLLLGFAQTSASNDLHVGQLSGLAVWCPSPMGGLDSGAETLRYPITWKVLPDGAGEAV